MINYSHVLREGAKAGSLELVNHESGTSYRPAGCVTYDRPGTPRRVFWEEIPPEDNLDRSIIRHSTKTWSDEDDPVSNFSAIKRAGTIRMTNYSVGRAETENFVVPYKKTWKIHGKGIMGYDVDFQSADCTESGRGITTFSSVKAISSPQTVETVYQTDSSRVYSDIPNLKYFGPSSNHAHGFDRAVESVQLDLITKMQSSYDLMTDAFEAKATYGLAKSLLKSAIAPMKELSKFVGELKKKPISTISGAWLTYRYGVMPVVYSLHDVCRMVESQHDEYLTHRSSRSYTNELLGSRDLSVPHIYTEGIVTREIRGTAKARFGSPSERNFDQVSLNALNAFWEIIPYSLVVDWFYNVGDFLKSALYTSFASEEKMCYTVKTDKVEYLKLYIPPKTVKVEPPPDFWQGPSSTIFVDNENYAKDKRKLSNELVEFHDDYVDKTLSKTETSSYDRVVFEPRAIRPSFNPDALAGRWYRQADAYAMSMLQILRHLPRG